MPSITCSMRLRPWSQVNLRSLGAAVVLVLGLLALGGSPVAIGPIGGAAGVHAASPSPSANVGGDTRSSGAGPGLVGAPGLAILAVLGLGVLTTLITTVYVRLSGGHRSSG
ncbi:MAG TPA: hypothetical protein VNF73_12390 [Candidatus Saccharimonadales bacterium]|nr:hypothetical protein [Candidatus Saccharimonadales bacterium]